MINPTITKKTDGALTVTENARKLFQLIYDEKNKPERKDDETPKIKVSELISKMAFYYEKIRNSVDYKEEYLLRKNAIFRILKRKIVIEGANKEANASAIAKDLLIELIRAGYLPNNAIPEAKIAEVGMVIGKYFKLKSLVLPKIKAEHGEQEKEISGWLWAMCASEIEEKFSQNSVAETIVAQMYDILLANIQLSADSLYANDKAIQIYLSIHRVYLKFDRDMLQFLLVKYFNANWLKAGDQEILKAANSFKALRLVIDNQMRHPLSAQLERIVSRYTVYFTILNDIIEDDPIGVFQGFSDDPKAFPRLIKKFCNKRYQAAKGKLSRAAVRSIIYIFLTKMLLAIVLEVPATTLFNEPLNYTSLGINVAFPPFLLFLIVLFTRVPSEANSHKIVQGIEEIVFAEKKRSEPFQLRPPAKRTAGFNFAFTFFYAVTFFLSFGLVVYALNRINFNIVSIIIFLFFLTLISFFGIRIRKVAREMFIIETKDSLLGFLVDFFYVPILAVGKWLNEKFSRLNVLLFILDFIIEAPFKIFVDITEEWTKYVKERKEEIM